MAMIIAMNRVGSMRVSFLCADAIDVKV